VRSGADADHFAAHRLQRISFARRRGQIASSGESAIAHIRDGWIASAVRASLLAFALALGVAGSLSGQSAPAGWSVDITQSRLTVTVLPAGLLAGTLHTHLFEPEKWSGEIEWDPSHPGHIRVAVRIAADSLRDHQPKLSASDVAKVERQARDARILDAARFPEILFEAGQIETADPPESAGEFRGRITGTLTLHGQSRPLRFPVQGRVAGERLEANASMTFRQSDFGIKPYATALGTIAVRDEVRIEIALVAVPRH
jgi:polyisoprenoid-binding protein YceI